MTSITRLVQTEGSKMSEILIQGSYMLICAFGSLIASIIVGYLGIFELDFSQGGSITSLKFNENSVNEIDNNLQGGYIIIDLLGLGQGEGGV